MIQACGDLLECSFVVVSNSDCVSAVSGSQRTESRTVLDDPSKPAVGLGQKLDNPSKPTEGAGWQFWCFQFHRSSSESLSMIMGLGPKLFSPQHSLVSLATLPSAPWHWMPLWCFSLWEGNFPWLIWVLGSCGLSPNGMWPGSLSKQSLTSYCSLQAFSALFPWWISMEALTVSL